MSYNQGGTNMLNWFYPTSQPSNTPNQASTTNFRINNVDICNNYIGIGTNSNIPVSQLYNIGYYLNSQSIGNLFELNLPNFTSGTINVDYKMFPSNGGLLIQFLNNTTLTFNYNVNGYFAMVAGGGGGGGWDQNNAGGGGGGGGMINGLMTFSKDKDISIEIGNGGYGGIGVNGGDGSNTSIMYNNTLANKITAVGGGGGGSGKASSGNRTYNSSGGSGSYSNTTTSPGTVTGNGASIIISPFSGFVYCEAGSKGNDQNNDSGAGGGGGGADTAAINVSNDDPGIGGNGITVTYGTTTFILGGGGGGGGRENGEGPFPANLGNGGAGGEGGGGRGGGYFIYSGSIQGSGFPGTANTGGGGGGGQNQGGYGGQGGSGTVLFYILPSGVSI